MQPKVTLINPPRFVLETIWVLWERSKSAAPMTLDVEEVSRTVPQDKLEKLFWDVLRQHIPIAEHIDFIFMLDGISVSLREQMVRHRIGTHVGDNFGVDIVPDLADSTWWSQSMRIQDMGRFADDRMYRVPESLKGKDCPNVRKLIYKEPTDASPSGTVPVTAEERYHKVMKIVQEGYKELVAAGVPMEDARELIPLGAQHSISWKINLQALLHVLGKRGCWILQLGIWGPIIHGMVNELALKVHPMFARIVAPPCIDQDDNFKSCQFRLENKRRLPDDDEVVHDAHPPCPLWLCSDEDGRARLREEADYAGVVGYPELTQDAEGAKYLLNNDVISPDNLVPRLRELRARAEEYKKLWHHDPYTWAKERTP